MAEVRITSYFSVDVDLADVMRPWPEFRSGQGYSLELEDADGQTVSVEYVDPADDEFAYVRVSANSTGALFERVLGRVAFELAACSDHLMVNRVSLG